jgi:hypothetical protein
MSEVQLELFNIARETEEQDRQALQNYHRSKVLDWAWQITNGHSRVAELSSPPRHILLEVLEGLKSNEELFGQQYRDTIEAKLRQLGTQEPKC